MNAAEWILVVVLALSCYNVGIIWLMQIHVYPLFGVVGVGEFRAYHGEHWRRIRYVVFVPAVLTLVGALLLLWLRPPGVPALGLWLGVTLQVVTYAVTGIFWAPLQIQLNKKGASPELLRRLIDSHWLRTGLITLYAALMLALTGLNFSE